MGCSSCSSAPKIAVQKTVQSVEEDLQRKVVVITNTKSRYSFPSTIGGTVQFPMTLVSQRPASGWGGTFQIKGLSIAVNAATPDTAIAKLVAVANINGLQLLPQDAWLWMNFAWMNASEPKRHRVLLADVAEALAGDESPLTIEAQSIIGTYTPKEWGSIAWRWLGFLLVSNEFDQAFCTEQMLLVLNRMNPETNPLTGCEECYLHFKEALDDWTQLSVSDVFTARKWLWRFHNTVNKRLGKVQVTWLAACQLNSWEYQA